MELSFSSYVCPGDSVTFGHGKFAFNVRLEFDDISTPYDFDCYNESDIERWKNDEWFYGGLVVSVWYNEIQLSHNITSLWGIECNFDENNSFLTEQAGELIEEVKGEAKELLKNIREKLAA